MGNVESVYAEEEKNINKLIEEWINENKHIFSCNKKQKELEYTYIDK